PDTGLLFDFGAMAGKVQKMLKNSLDSLVRLDGLLALEVIRADDEVDAMNREMYLRVSKALCDQKGNPNTLLHQFMIARHLERTADQATNIAEDVIYMIEGQIVRHKTEDYRMAHKKRK
ncbi:MAG TPA: phosphate transport system regulatory protein PhoU, partial [bacterium]|nr:phosphate transport system regulatory protein PhoU [bacterium]